MGVDIAVYRARIGNFNHIKMNSRVHLDRAHPSVFSLPLLIWHIFKITLLLILPIVVLLAATVMVVSFFSFSTHKLGLQFLSFRKLSNKDHLYVLGFFSLLVQLLLLVSGNVHSNPGPPMTRSQISFCCWNIDSLLARDRAKIGLIESLQSVHNFDIFGVCESYLTSNTDPQELIIDGFSPTPFRSDCKDAASRPRGGVCLYFKEHLPNVNLTDLSNNIDETLVCEIRLHSKKIFIVLSYRP